MNNPNQTPNNAIFPIFQHANHEFGVTDHMNCNTPTVYDHYDQLYQLMKSSDHSPNDVIFPIFKHAKHEI